MSRTFGDIESKTPELGGLKGVVVAEPEITVFPCDSNIDYVLLGCDGIYDALTNEEVNEVVWETIEFYKAEKMGIKGQNLDLLLGQCLGDCVNNILKKSLVQNSEDNVTAIIVVFRNLLEE